MSDTSADEPPLDPASERLRRKMLRLLAVAVATMLIGLMAVLAAIVYKVNADLAPPDPNAPPITIALPQGATVEDTALGGGEALLTLGGSATGTLVRVDLKTGAILSRYTVTTR